MLKPLTVWITANWEILKEIGIPDYLTSFLGNLYENQEATVRIRQKQWTASKSGKEHVKVIYCHSAYLIYMQSTSWKMPGWINHKLESRLSGEISITSDDATVMAETKRN